MPQDSLKHIFAVSVNPKGMVASPVLHLQDKAPPSGVSIPPCPHPSGCSSLILSEWGGLENEVPSKIESIGHYISAFLCLTLRGKILFFLWCGRALVKIIGILALTFISITYDKRTPVSNFLVKNISCLLYTSDAADE